MTTMRFNAISYAARLKNAGVEVSIADVHAEELSNILMNDIATKKDLETVKNEMIVKLGSIVIRCTVIISLIICITSFLMKKQF